MKARILLICFLLSGEWIMAQTKITNTVGMEFVLIDAGTVVIGEFKPPYPVPADTVKSLPHDYMMWMGDGRSYNEEEFRLAKEMAVRDSKEGIVIQIAKSYYMATTEVTQGQWKKVMGYNPSQFKGDSLPVENVSWKEAQKFIKKLNQLEKHKSYRLPSEVEWEHAARAGAKKDIPWKEIEASANLNKKTPSQLQVKNQTHGGYMIC